MAIFMVIKYIGHGNYIYICDNSKHEISLRTLLEITHNSSTHNDRFTIINVVEVKIKPSLGNNYSFLGQSVKVLHSGYGISLLESTLNCHKFTFTLESTIYIDLDLFIVKKTSEV